MTLGSTSKVTVAFQLGLVFGWVTLVHTLRLPNLTSQYTPCAVNDESVWDEEANEEAPEEPSPLCGCGSLICSGAVFPVMSPGVTSGGALIPSVLASNHESCAFQIVRVYFSGGDGGVGGIEDPSDDDDRCRGRCGAASGRCW